MTDINRLRRPPSLPRQTAVSVALWIGVGLIVLATARWGPLVALVAMAVLLIPVVTIKAPEYVLAAGVVLTLAGGAFSYLSSVGGAVLVLGAVTSAFSLALSPSQLRWQRLVVPLLILVWLGLRVSLEENFEPINDIVKCVSVLVLVLHGLQRERDVVAGLAVGGVLFVLVSALLGDHNPSGTRFQGISGNPNRMVFGLLVFLPFLLALLVPTRPRGVRLLVLAASALTVVMVVLSGSAQGIAGLATALAVLMACLAVGLPRGLRAATVLTAIASLVVALGAITRAVESSPDLRTLSGRTPIYVAAVHDILHNPFAGSGLQRFSEGTVVDLSAHSVVLALAATGGIPLAIGWVAVLVSLGVATMVLIRARNPLAVAPAVLVVEQFVQTVQLIPCTWVIVALFLLSSDRWGLALSLLSRGRQHELIRAGSSVRRPPFAGSPAATKTSP